jgi:Putative bacterial sensory transduction regulator
MSEAREIIAAYLDDGGLEYDEPKPGVFVVVLPGEHKLATNVSLVVGAHSVSVQAFVARRPDEAHDEVHRWLLERNARMYGVAFALDSLGDIYLAGHVPLHAVTSDEVDRILGAVLEYADGSFDTIVGMGFASSIRHEWEWRTARGESTRNLDAFRMLIEQPTREHQKADKPTDERPDQQK